MEAAEEEEVAVEVQVEVGLEGEVGQDLGQGLETPEDPLGQSLCLEPLEDHHGQVDPATNQKKVKHRKPLQH